MRRKELDEKAEQDEVYLFWKRCVEDLEGDFKAYLKAQPKETYRLISGYVGACCMMLQRKALLACEDEKPE
jgi:hypothetical protein